MSSVYKACLPKEATGLEKDGMAILKCQFPIQYDSNLDLVVFIFKKVLVRLKFL